MKFSKALTLVILLVAMNCSRRYTRKNRQKQDTVKHLPFHNRETNKFLRGNGFDLTDSHSNLRTFKQAIKRRERKK